jgi:RNase adaptor protein for sRNA GlmZ degradation|tara:strand:- start:240 stop:827 length:588 start_codon:yes stop_codon:yes gene_type:complete
MDKLKNKNSKCYKEIIRNDLVEKFKNYNEQFATIKERVNKKIDSTINRIKELKRNKIIILSGYPGSGKSTITQLLKDIGYKILSLDDNIKNYKELSEIAKDLVENKKIEHLVLDGTFLRQKDLDEFKWVEEKKNYDLLFIYMNISIYYAYYNNINRCLDRRSKRKLVPFKVYENLEKNKDIIFPEKGVYVIDYNV